MKIINLQIAKAINPVNYNQVQKLTSFDNLIGLPSTSQMIKRLEVIDFEEILELLESGEEIKIEG